jgi:transketolase
MNNDKVKQIEQISRKLRTHIVEMTSAAQSGHPGGSLSSIDIIACLYFGIMKIDPKNPQWKERDRFVLSKGHGAPALYSALAEAGFFPAKYLTSLRQVGSALQGHPDMKGIPGVDMTTGSLGQGLSAAVGMALGFRIDSAPNYVYCVIGDGESQEGQIWEAAMSAGHHKLDHLIAILDRNQLQIDGKVEDIKGIEPVADKWRAFRWNVIEVDGHNIKDLLGAFEKAKANKGKPTMIIANTVKGKGVSFMEWNNAFHGKAATAEELKKAVEEING